MAITLTKADRESWLAVVWDALEAYREHAHEEPPTAEQDREYDDVCTSMSWIREELGLMDEVKRENMIDRLVEDSVDTILSNDTHASGLDQLLRGGFKGYNTMEQVELEYEYKCREFPEDEEDEDTCILCKRVYRMGETGNELGFCLECQVRKDFPYDVDAYYKAYENNEVAFKGVDTMRRGLLEPYRKHNFAGKYLYWSEKLRKFVSIPTKQEGS